MSKNLSCAYTVYGRESQLGVQSFASDATGVLNLVF